MPATVKQMRTAGRELRMRREGEVKRERVPRSEQSRPMSSMSTANLKKYAQSIDKEIMKLERRLKDTGSAKHADRLMRAKRQKRREYGE